MFYLLMPLPSPSVTQRETALVLTLCRVVGGESRRGWEGGREKEILRAPLDFHILLNRVTNSNFRIPRSHGCFSV